MANTPSPKTTQATARKKTSASRPTSASDSHIFTKYIGSLELKPRQQSHMSLGLFNPAKPAKGFLVNVSPDPSAPDSVTTQITSLGNTRHYELILRVANYSDQELQAEIWEF